MFYNIPKSADTENGAEKLRNAMMQADAVIIGAGAGLSTSAGFTYSGERFQRYFGDFAEKYHFNEMYSGGFYPYPSLEDQWAFWSRYIYINRYVFPPKPVYQELLEIVKDKDYFVLTTNVDHQFQKAGFDKQRLFYTQGDYGLWQCSRPCHKRTYDNKETVVKMLLAQGFSIGKNSELIVPEKENGETDFSKLTMKVPYSLIPYCPVCGEPMSMNLRSDDTFVEDDGWRRASDRFSDFLQRHRNCKTLFLELGVGWNTPGIIKMNFWRMTGSWKDATYACLNFGDACAPDEIRKKAICINGDIGEVLRQVFSDAQHSLIEE